MAVLTSLPVPLWITTDPSSLLRRSLEETGKKPEQEVCHWSRPLRSEESIFSREPDYVPRIERPLVFHLFGHLADPDSLVITEDDYFDYLIATAKDADLVPGEVKRNMASSALLFLGFQLDSWEFRILFRSIMRQEGRFQLGRYSHVAVQVDLEEPLVRNTMKAKEYLKSYFQKQSSAIDIYSGSVRQFIQDLDHDRDRWEID